jgi:hypothetical protein
MGELGLSVVSGPAAEQQNSKQASHYLERKKDEDAGVEPGSPIAGRDRENIIRRRVQEVFIKIGT